MQADRANPFLPPAEYTGRTYYNVPAVKPSHYGGKTALAFFIQGIGSSAQMIATILDMQNRERNRGCIRTGRSIALLASPLGPLLLITALHTPGRWYNMLRIYRPLSPMSIGIWALTTMGALNCLSFGGTLLEKTYPKAGKWVDRLFGSAAAAAGGIVAIYMGTELEETSSPVWTGAYPYLAPLFAATAFSNGTAALMLASRNGSGAGAALALLARLGGVAAGLQVIITALMFRRLNRSLGASSSRSRLKWAVWPATIAPLLLRGWHLLSGQPAAFTSTGVATLLGGFSLLNALVYTGKRSGQVPQEYLELTAGPPPPRTVPERKAIRAARRPRSGAAGRIGMAIAAGFAGFWVGRRLLSPSGGRPKRH